MSDKPTNVLLLIWTFLTSPIAIAIISYIAGAITSLFAPWNKWFIEKRKIRFNNKKEKIRQWKEDISKNREDYDSFKKTVTFYELKNRIPPEELTSFSPPSHTKEGNPIIYLTVGKGKDKVGRFQEVVSEIEKEWEII